MQQFIALFNQTTPAQWVLAFLLMVVTDISWAKYTSSTAEGTSPAKASAWAVALFLLGGMSVVSYTANPVLLVPASFGAAVGTYLGVRKKKQ